MKKTKPTAKAVARSIPGIMLARELRRPVSTNVCLIQHPKPGPEPHAKLSCRGDTLFDTALGWRLGTVHIPLREEEETIPIDGCLARQQRRVTLAPRTSKKVDLRDESPRRRLRAAPVLCTQSHTLSKKFPEKI
jgi:hypothetical protein